MAVFKETLIFKYENRAGLNCKIGKTAEKAVFSGYVHVLTTKSGP